MNKLILFLFAILCFVALIIGCSDMNEKHDMFFQKGERIYIGKIDSLHILPGNNRVQLKFWVSDPRCKKVGFYWYPSNDSIFKEIRMVNPKESYDIFIGDVYKTKSITEGKHTFRVKTFDNEGNYSIPFEKIVDIYGDLYKSSLINRPLQEANYSSEEKKLTLKFSESAINEAEIGIEIFYTNNEGNLKTIKLITDSLDSFSTIDIFDLNPEKGVKYFTKYLPQPLALDTLAVDFKPIEFFEKINVALNKPVTWSDEHASGLYPGTNAVDGINLQDASRWVSTAVGEHWIEIDLEQEHEIFSIETWNGQGNKLSDPVPEFMFQVEVDGEWVTVAEVANNSEAGYVAVFPEINTRKVRYFIPEYSKNNVRLYEIAIYTKKTY